MTLVGCKQDMDNTKLAPYLYDYLPASVGHSVTYDVDSIGYNYIVGDTQIVTNVHYQLREVILDSGNSVCLYQPGVTCYGVAEYKRYDTTQPFPSNYLYWYFYLNKSTYVTNYQDLAFENFTFPPITGNTWLGNSLLPANDTIQDTYQPYAGWVYTYTSVNVPNTVNGHHFDSTAVVSDVNDTTNLVNDVFCTEIYARHVGLVFRQFEVITKQGIFSSWANPDSATGFRIKQWFHSSP